MKRPRKRLDEVGPPQLRRGNGETIPPCCVNWTELEEAPKVDIVGAFDVHRKQITFDYVQTDSGEVHRGKIRPADRESLREWLDEFTERFSGKQIAIAVEATTGWRYVVEEIKRAGIEPHLAEPAETKSLQGRKKRAKTDRLDAGHLRDLMVIERLPESWIPPDHIQEIRTLMRLRHSLIEERTTHKQRIHAQLFHSGYPRQSNLDSIEGRAYLEDTHLPGAARKVVDLSLAMIEHINEELAPIEKQLRAYARCQAGCQALMMGHYGVGELTSVALLSELGDTRRFSSSKKAVRYAGMDITVHSSDDRRSAGKLSRQGPPVLRWAAFGVAKRAWRKNSLDHEYYLKNKERIGANRATLSIARKLIRRAHHTLRELGGEAISEPVLTSGSA
jgi:transposase